MNIKGIGIGDGSFGNGAALTDVVAATYISKQNDKLNVPNNVLNVFKEADQRCGFTTALQQATYPPNGTIKIPSNPEGENFKLKGKRQTASQTGCISNPKTPALVNQSINACNLEPGSVSACATFTTELDYLNISRPWYDTVHSKHHSHPLTWTTQLQALQHRLQLQQSPQHHRFCRLPQSPLCTKCDSRPQQDVRRLQQYRIPRFDARTCDAARI